MNLSLAKALDRVAGGALARVVAGADAVRDLVLPPPPPVERVRTIAVLKFWGVGNWALLRPVVEALRDRWTGARVVVVTLAANAPLVADVADRVLAVRPAGLVATATDLLRALRALRAEAPDLSLDFEQFAVVGALLCRAAGIPQRVGFASGARGRDGLLTVRVPFRRDAHAARSFRDLAEAAGVPRGPYVPGGLRADDAGRAEVATLLGDDAGRPVVVLHPGSGDNFPGRRWSPTAFAAVGRHASERFAARVVVTGAAGEASLVTDVARRCGGDALAAAGALSLRGLVALLARAAVVVSNDTGPVHLASALGRPVLAMFGPNTPVLYGPLSPGSRSFHAGLPCSPCLTTDNYRSSRCRIHTCMAAIPTGEVVAALDRLLRAAPAARAEAP
ncbi:MAG: glycosyltransferase family 9 protein [Planctomycetota bacterium]